MTRSSVSRFWARFFLFLVGFKMCWAVLHDFHMLKYVPTISRGITVRHEPHRTLLTFFEYVRTVNAAFLKLAQRLLSRIERICIYLKLENFQLPCSCTFLHVHWRDCRDSLTALALLLTGNNPMFSVWKVPISNFLIVVCIASAPVFKKDELSFSLFCAHIAWEIKN